MNHGISFEFILQDLYIPFYPAELFALHIISMIPFRFWPTSFTCHRWRCPRTNGRLSILWNANKTQSTIDIFESTKANVWLLVILCDLTKNFEMATTIRFICYDLLTFALLQIYYLNLWIPLFEMIIQWTLWFY